MNRFLAWPRTRAGCCLWIVFAELVLKGAQPAGNLPVSSPVSAQAAPQRLSLLQAQRVAFQQNWDLLAAKSGIDSASAQLIVAQEFPNPTLSWSTMKIDPRGNATPLGNSFWDRSYD